ncbi:MAG: hypothetical protein V8Q27_06395 [Eubacteriales bacterium]
MEKVKSAGRKISGFVKKHKVLTVLLVLILIAAIVAGVIGRVKVKSPRCRHSPSKQPRSRKWI